MVNDSPLTNSPHLSTYPLTLLTRSLFTLPTIPLVRAATMRSQDVCSRPCKNIRSEKTLSSVIFTIHSNHKELQAARAVFYFIPCDISVIDPLIY